MAFSFELELAISPELYRAISAGPEQQRKRLAGTFVPASLLFAEKEISWSGADRLCSKNATGFNQWRSCCEWMLPFQGWTHQVI